MQDIIWFLEANWDLLAVVLISGVAFGEAVVRLTPTKTDDGFMDRVAKYVNMLLKWFPNNVKKDK